MWTLLGPVESVLIGEVSSTVEASIWTLWDLMNNATDANHDYTQWTDKVTHVHAHGHTYVSNQCVIGLKLWDPVLVIKFRLAYRESLLFVKSCLFMGRRGPFLKH